MKTELGRKLIALGEALLDDNSTFLQLTELAAELGLQFEFRIVGEEND